MAALTPRKALNRVNHLYESTMKHRDIGGGLLSLSRTAMDYLHTYVPSVGGARAYLINLMNSSATEEIDILQSPTHFFALIATFQPYMDRMCRSVFSNGVNPREGDAGHHVLDQLLRDQFYAQNPHATKSEGIRLNVATLDSLMQKGLFTEENFKTILEAENPLQAAELTIAHPPGTAVEMQEAEPNVL